MAGNQVEINVLANVAQAKAALASVQRQLELLGVSAKATGVETGAAAATAERTGRSFTGMATGVKAGVAAFAGYEVVQKAYEFLKDSVLVAENVQAAHKRLAVAVKNSGQSWKTHGKEIDEFIDKAAKANGFVIPQLDDAFGKLQVATKNTHKTQTDLNLSMDVARGRNIDLATASQIVLKAQEGQTAALKRMGVVVKPVTTDVDKLKHKMDELRAAHVKLTPAQEDLYRAAMKEAKAHDATATSVRALSQLQHTYAGQAAGFDKTWEGQLARLGVKWDGLKEKVGTFLGPYLATIFNRLGTLLDNIASGHWKKFFQNLSKDIDDAEATVGIAALHLGETLLMSIVNGLAGIGQAIIDKITSEINGVGGALSGLGSSIGSKITGGIGGAIGGVTGSIANAWKGIGGATGMYVHGRYGADDVPIRVTGDEAVLNPTQINLLGRGRVMDVLRATGAQVIRRHGSYAGGGSALSQFLAIPATSPTRTTSSGGGGHSVARASAPSVTDVYNQGRDAFNARMNILDAQLAKAGLTTSVSDDNVVLRREDAAIQRRINVLTRFLRRHGLPLSLRGDVSSEVASLYRQLAGNRQSLLGSSTGQDTGQADLNGQLAYAMGVDVGLGRLGSSIIGGAGDLGGGWGGFGGGGVTLRVSHLQIANTPANTRHIATASNRGNAVHNRPRTYTARTVHHW